MSEVETARPAPGMIRDRDREAAGASSDGPGLLGRLPRLPRWPLSRTAGVLGLIGLAFIAATIAVLALSERRRVERETERDLRQTAYFLADHAARLFETSDLALRGATAIIEGASWDELAASEELHRRLRATVAALPYLDDIWLTDESGELRLTTFAFPTPRVSSSERELFRFHRRPNDALFVSERTVDRVSGRPTFSLSRRLQGAAGEFRGIVVVTAGLGYFDDFWSRVRLPLDARVTLFRTGDADALAQSGGGQPAGAAEAFRATVAANGSDGVAEMGDAASGPRLAARRQVGDLPAHLGLSVSREAMNRRWHEEVDGYAALAGAAFLTLSGFTLVAFRQARRETADREAIEAARAALADANVSLESTVAERTAELRESNEEIQRFAYIVSHDLRSPLVNVMGFTSELETLRSDIKAELKGNPAAEAIDHDISKSLGFIKASTVKMDRLINAILNLSREGRRAFRLEPIDMGALVAGIANSMRHQLEETGTELIAGDLPTLQSDRLALEQIFGNLLDNAVKYGNSSRPGRIEVTGRDAGHALVYEVRDNGRGIDPGDHARVFDLFRRSGVQDRPGEGIGLAHVRQLVRKLGGRIELSSTLGEGATFRLTFPKRAGEAAHEAA